MDKFKRLRMPVTAAFMLLCMPLLTHADDSVLIYPGEGNFTCNNAAPNKTIESMGGSTSDGSGIVYGNENVNDPDSTGEESAHYAIDTDTNAFGFFGSTTPIDFVALKGTDGVLIFFLPSGGLKENLDMVIPDGLGGNQDIASFSLCYGLDNDPLLVEINNAPELTHIEDVVFTLGDTPDEIRFDVYATDVDDDALTITATPGTHFTDNGNGTGEFLWEEPGVLEVGSTNITFVVSDGALIDTQTITITVNGPAPTTPNCDTDGVLDSVGVTCDATAGQSVVCNMQVGEEFFGVDIVDHCCVCNGGDSLVRCDPDLMSEDAPSAIGPPCTDTSKLGLEVTTHIEFNNDPYYCTTIGGSRTCFRY